MNHTCHKIIFHLFWQWDILLLVSVTVIMGFIRYSILMQEMNRGRGHPPGTCVLLEVPSIKSLVQYFRAILSIADNFELKGMQTLAHMK